MSPRLIPAFIAALVAVVLVPVAPAAAATVHLAIVGDLSGSLTVPEAIWAGQVVGGVLGAIGERAAAAVLAGGAADPVAQPLPINVTAAAALGAAAVQAQVAATLGAVPTIVAVLAPARGAAAEGAVAACVAAGIPVVGPETTNQAHYVGATPGSNGSAVIHWRPDAATEAVAQLRFLTHGQPHVRQLMVAFSKPFEGAVAAVKAGAAAMGLPAPILVNLSLAPDATTMATMVAGTYALTPKKPHGVMLLIDDPSATLGAVLAVVGAGGLPNTTFFTATSFATLPLWKYPINGVFTALPFASTFHASSIPHYADSRFVFATKFRAAAAAYGGIAGAVPSLAGISGYAAARLVLAAVDRVPRSVATITGQVVLKTIYALRTVELDDWTVGPLSAGCSGYQRPGGDACACNSGGRVVFTTRINETTGLTEPWKEAATTKNSAEVAVPASKCGLETQGLLTVPYIQVTYFDQLLPQPTLAVQYFSLDFAGQYLYQEILKGNLRKDMYAQGYATRNITRHQVELLAERFPLFLQLAPSSVDLRAAMANPALPFLTLAESRLTYYDADPPTMPLAQWNPNFIPLFPVMADFAHTAAAYAVKLGRGGSIHIVADTDALASLARRSVETHAQVPPTSVRVIGPLTNATTALATQPLAGGAARAFVVVVSQNPLLLKAVQKAALALMPLDTVVALCSSEFILPQALEATAAVAKNVIFAAGVPSYTDEGAKGNPLNAYGVVYGRFTVAFGNLDTGTDPTPQASVDALYAVGSLSAGTASVGPLSKTDCGLTAPSSVRPAGHCQCSKGLTTFHMRNVTSWAIALGAAALGSPIIPPDGTPLYSHRLPDCGVRYTALPTEETGLRGTALLLTVAGSAVAAVAVVAATAFLLYYCCVARAGMRDNKTAPKDASQPFAMVFTDIQASTTLWAHAPHAMGPALDTHHAILRRLVSQHKGYEVKTIGDSFMVAFSDAQPAVAFALAVQDALFDHDWGTQLLDSTYQQLGFGVVPEGGEVPQASQRLPNYEDIWNGLRVRVGVHFGEGSIKFDETSKGYDYYGTVVNTAARVEGVAHGGQVLLTGDAMARLEATASKLPNSVVVDDLGPQPLRGLNEPVKLTQLLPGRFGDRKYPPLRLDVEVEVNEDEDDADEERAASGADSGTPDFEHRRPTVATLPDDSTSASGTVIDGSSPLEAVANRLARGNVNTSAHAVLFAHEVMYRALAPLPPKDQLAFAKKVAAAWRVPAEPPFGGSLRRAAKRLKPQELLMLQVSARALQAAASAGALFAPSDVDHRRSMPEATPMQGNAFTLMTSVRKDSTMLNSFAAQGSRRASNASSGAGAVTASAPAPPSLPTPKHISGSVRILVPGEVGP